MNQTEAQEYEQGRVAFHKALPFIIAASVALAYAAPYLYNFFTGA